jgi:hypothetical protein
LRYCSEQWRCGERPPRELDELNRFHFSQSHDKRIEIHPTRFGDIGLNAKSNAPSFVVGPRVLRTSVRKRIKHNLQGIGF